MYKTKEKRCNSVHLRNIEDSQYGNAEIGAYKDTGFISKIDQEYKEYTLQQLLAWKHQFGRHFVEWMVGHENYDYKLNFDAIQKKNESFPGIDELSNFTTTTYSEGYKDTYAQKLPQRWSVWKMEEPSRRKEASAK